MPRAAATFPSHSLSHASHHVIRARWRRRHSSQHRETHPTLRIGPRSEAIKAEWRFCRRSNRLWQAPGRRARPSSHHKLRQISRDAWLNLLLSSHKWPNKQPSSKKSSKNYKLSSLKSKNMKRKRNMHSFRTSWKMTFKPRSLSQKVRSDLSLPSSKSAWLERE